MRPLANMAAGLSSRQVAAEYDLGRGCSTFLLAQGDDLLVGHNLDEPSEVPGMIVINNRGVAKESLSWEELLTSRKPTAAGRSWISRYGSATFNPLGREFADGGMNEAGLCVNEMTLDETRYGEDDSRPRMFMMLWIQYQLDNFDSVEQVLANLSEFSLDGWGWHFLVSDRKGDCAVIEFLEGQPLIYSGEALPVPALCNSPYLRETKELEEFEGFGGTREVDLGDDSVPRFVHAAHMLKAYERNPSGSALDYAFEILSGLERGRTKWSYVLDLRSLRAYFRTSIGRHVKFFDLTAFDLSCHSPAQMMDVNTDLTEEVSEEFVDCTFQANRDYIAQAFQSLDAPSDFLESLESKRTTLEQLIDNMAEYPHSTSCFQ
jgi:penicillin V acylase-like amidase (Ntn superfamily)